MSFDTATNRISTSWDGTAYDVAGNMTASGGGGATYDAEKRITQAVIGAATVGQYAYDGHGRRIKSTSPVGGTTTTTWYLYDAQGRLLQEYTGAVNPPLFRTYYYRGSEMVATTDTNNTWRFLAKDALGSTRLISGR
ncbi:MAG: hypothetical protein HY232_11900 [Acidobacteria bacterium]|nr:hypothetical protein [Acidobacteriota bacterium]